MHVRLETQYAGLVIPFRASRIRYVRSTQRHVYYFSIDVDQIDAFLRDYYRYVATYRYYSEIRNSNVLHVFGNLSLRLSSTTLQLTLSHTDIYGYRHYHLYYAPSIVRAIGFYPQDDDSWMIVDQDRKSSSDTSVRPVLRYIANKYR